MTDSLNTKEDLTRIKLKLIKIAAMLHEDGCYSKEDAFQDVIQVIEDIENIDIPIKHILED